MLALATAVTAQSTQDTGISELLDSFIGQEMPLNISGDIQKILDIVLPIKVQLVFTETNNSYIIEFSQTKMISVTKMITSDLDLKVEIPEQLIDEFLTKQEKDGQEIFQIVQNDSVIFYPKSFKADLVLQNAQELLGLELNIVRETNPVIKSIVNVITTVIGLLNKIFGFIKLN